MSRRLTLVFENTIPWLVLVVLLAFTISGLFFAPYLGFFAAGSAGRVGDVYVYRTNGLRVDDLIRSVNGVDWATIRADITKPQPWVGVQPGQTLNIIVERQGEEVQVDWPVAGFNRKELLGRLINNWPVAYFFWLAGVATVLLVRPRDTRSRALEAFCFVTAIWLAAGSFSYSRLFATSIALRVGVWMSLPIYLHLHWVFPARIKRLPRYFWFGFYIAAGLLALAQVFSLLPTDAYFVPFAIAVIGSIAFLAYRFLFRKEDRREVRLLFFSAAVAFTPALLAASSSAAATVAPVLPGLLFGLMALPGAYFYVMYRRNLGGMEFRANRLISLYLYLLILFSLLFLLIPYFFDWTASVESATATVFSAVILTAVLTVLAFRGFQGFVERRILRMPLPPENLLENYAAEISTSISLEHLVRVLRDEVLPSMFIRQSVLFQENGNQGNAILFAVGVEPKEIPDAKQQAAIIKKSHDGSGKQPYQGPGAKWPVAFPLWVNGELVGLWLLGQKDPDGYYSHQEIGTLSALADQTAIALVNIAQATRLRALHQADIDRQEQERTSLALELHDEVLNQLAALGMTVEDSAYTPEFERRMHDLNDHIRRTIHGLRPPMLNYGLHAALRELAEDLEKRPGAEVKVELDVPATDARFDPKIEQHMFRIIQQACENALRHAAPKHVVIEGEISERVVDLKVRDDGSGFEMNSDFDLSQLLAQRHFGLASIFERAALISAQMELHSSPGQGTIVHLKWSAS